MAEKLKVFKNVNAVNSGATTTIPIVTTTATSQAVVKSIHYKVSDPDYAVTGTIVQDGFTLNTGQQAPKGTEATDVLSGSQIVDSSATLNLVVDYEAPSYIGNQDARIFNYSAGLYKVVNTSTTELESATYDDIEASFQTTLLSTPTGLGNTYSAFGWLEGTTKKYGVSDQYVVRTFNEAGTLIQTSASWTESGCYGVCTDGTYFYGVRSGSTDQLQRIKVSDGSLAETITMSTTVFGQNGNQGSFTLYDKGYVYGKREGDYPHIWKINVITGEVEEFDFGEFHVSSYSAGGLITYAANGDPYIVELGASSPAYAFNLESKEVTQISHSLLSLSTEYGNTVLEIAPGVAQFHYNDHHVWIDVNTMTGSVKLGNAGFGNGAIPYLENRASIANIPLHQIPGNKLPANITYSLYADGVEITGA